MPLVVLPPAGAEAGGGDLGDDRRPPAPLQSTWAVAAAAGEPVALVRVSGLQGTLRGGAAARDAWGRTGKAQPAVVAADVSFASPFGASSAGDRVGAETAHYGNLSKTLLGALERLGDAAPVPPAAAEEKEEGGSAAVPGAADVLELLWAALTGRVVDGGARALPPDQVPFLDAARLRGLNLTLRLPKASLVGAGGVSLTATACFRAGEAPPAAGDAPRNPLTAYARRLALHGLHVPTLIGVNPNERLAKQMVIAEVEIDRLDVTKDIYPELERLVVEVGSPSSAPTYAFFLFRYYL